MKWSVVGLALAFGIAGSAAASAQGMPQLCQGFFKLRDDAQQKGLAIGAAQKRHADRKEVCTLVQRYAVAEGAALKFLEANKTWCGVPDQALASSRTSHEQTLKFRTVVCSEDAQPHPKAPTLSEAISGPPVDTAKNTKTGRGTFDTLTGNPLAK
jgi:hypothetical protein